MTELSETSVNIVPIDKLKRERAGKRSWAKAPEQARRPSYANALERIAGRPLRFDGRRMDDDQHKYIIETFSDPMGRALYVVTFDMYDQFDLQNYGSHEQDEAMNHWLEMRRGEQAGMIHYMLRERDCDSNEFVIDLALGWPDNRELAGRGFSEAVPDQFSDRTAILFGRPADFPRLFRRSPDGADLRKREA